MDIEHNTSPYKRGADAGFYFSGILCMLFFAGVYSVKVPVLSIVSAVIALAVPYIIYKSLRKSYVTDHGATTMSSLWMQGIVTFACGCAVSGLIAIIYLKWIDPDFLMQRIYEAIALYRDSHWDSAANTADVLEKMIESGIMPGTVEFVMEAIWLGIFSGSMLSLLMALLVRARGIPAKK